MNRGLYKTNQGGCFASSLVVFRYHSPTISFSMKNSYILPACFFLFVSGAFAQTVGPDPGFGNNGLVITDMEKFPGNAFSRDLLLQPDGKLILGGETPGNDFVLRRYHPNGTPDASFQTGEFLYGKNYGLGFQGSDKILLYDGAYLYRLDITGERDSSFGDNGAIALPYTTGFGTGLNLQSDGKILVWGAGVDGDTTYNDFYMVRVTSDGQVDSTFAENGLFWFDYSGDIDIPWAATVLSDGKILLGGIAYLPGWRVLLLRLYPDGTIDSTFGTNGHFTSGFKGSAELYGIAVQQDNKIVISGYTRTGSVSEAIVARLNPEGKLDSTFGDFGIRYFPQLYEGYEIAVRPDNKIVFCAVKKNPVKIAVVQLLENGQNDPAFGDGGEYFFSQTGLLSRSLVFPDTHKIVVSGTHADPPFTGVLVGLLTNLTLGSETWGNTDQPAVWAYPNPVSDVVQLRFQLEQREILNISLSDANGRALTTFYSESDFEAGEHKLSLNIPPGTPPGTYFLQVNGKGKATTIQLIKH
ncbi:MAG: hypothetical protein EPGJADBJ_04978 [Saprospiraceae bacterium]|nr:hypothetical protein [Saprospiraceae bacterium]